MEVSKCFEILIGHLEKRTDLFARVKANLKADLEYFREQSLCDSDRIHDALKIKNRWLTFIAQARKLGLFEALEVSAQFWNQVESFVGTRTVTPLTAAPNNKIQPDNFFRNLALKAARDEKIRSLERVAILIGLKYLETEAKRARPQRDVASIQYTWRSLHGLLEKHQLLENFKRNPILVHHIKFFIADRI